MPKHKLSIDQIRTIFLSVEPAPAAALRFNVSADTIYMIRRRLAHCDVTSDLPEITRSQGRPRRPRSPQTSETPPKSKQIVITLTDDEIRAIYLSTSSLTILAKQYGVPPHVIQSIRDRKSFAYTTKDLRRPHRRPQAPPLPSNGPKLRSLPTPGIDFVALAQSHQNLERPRAAVGRVRLRPGYKGGKEIIAYLLPLIS